MRGAALVALGIILGLICGLSLLGAPPATHASAPAQAAAARPRVRIDAETADTAAMVSNLLTCREGKARDACAANPHSLDCKEARRAVLGDGIFARLRDLGNDKREKRLVAALALNKCRAGSESAEQADLGELLRTPIEPLAEPAR